jgi:hypothetical protein
METSTCGEQRKRQLFTSGPKFWKVSREIAFMVVVADFPTDLKGRQAEENRDWKRGKERRGLFSLFSFPSLFL